MDDIFLEKIVTKRKTGKEFAIIGGAVLASVLLLAAGVIFGSLLPFLMPMILVGVGYGLWFVISSMNKEYEYIVTNGDLDIDMIIARRKRKRVLSVKAKEFELMAQTGTIDEKDSASSRYKTLDFSSSTNSKSNWFILTTHNSERVKVIFEPDERMLKNLKRFNPSKIKYTGLLN